MIKNFFEWFKVKEVLHERGRAPTFKEGEVWWAAVGENVGTEINGKSETFSRPVIIFRKLSKYCFLAILLTSQEHYGSWYVDFVLKDKKQFVSLA